MTVQKFVTYDVLSTEGQTLGNQETLELKVVEDSGNYLIYKDITKYRILTGFLIGIVATAFGFYIYVEFVSTYSFEETIKILNEGNLYGKVLGLAAIPNLFVFFIFRCYCCCVI